MIFFLGMACTTSEAPAPTAAPAARPDVVVVTLDTVRADRIGAYGYAGARTDTIDQLAASGLRFEHAFSVLPLTIPAHASLFTGLYPFHHGIRANGDNVLAESHLTLAEQFKAAGYATGASVAAFVTTRQWGFAQGFDAYFDEMPETDSESGRDRNYWHTERSGDKVVDDALAWLSMIDKQKPVFLWIHLYDAHFPYQAPAAYQSQEQDRPYDAEIAFVDDLVGRVTSAFSGRDAIFALVADHGESLGEHHELTHGVYAYPSTQHIPWIVSGSGVSPRVVKEPVSSVDFAPTLLALAGLPELPGVDGRAQPGKGAVPYAESYQVSDRFGLAPHRVVADGNLLLVGTPRPELYDYVADPGAKTDLAAGRPDDVARLRAVLEGLGATPPGTGGTEADADTLAALEALGYVSAPANAKDPSTLPDPKDYAEFLRGALALDRPKRNADLETTVAKIDALLAMKPDAFELRRRKSTMLKRLGLRGDAERFDLETAALFPDEPRVWSQLAVAAAMEGDFTAALEHGEKALTLGTPDDATREIVVDAMFRLGKEADALERGSLWMSEDPRNYGLAAVMGRYWLTKREYAKAEQFLRVAVAGPNPRLGARLRLAALAIAAGARADGIKLLLAEVKDFPGNVQARRAIARVYAEDGDYLSQLEHQRFIARAQPNEPLAQFDLAQCQFNLADYAGARRTLDVALAKWPDDADLVLLHANLLAKEGKREEGQAVFTRAQALNQARIEAAKARNADAAKAAAEQAPTAGDAAAAPGTSGATGGGANTVARPAPRGAP